MARRRATPSLRVAAFLQLSTAPPPSLALWDTVI